jgi:mannose-1-phosphate guanylyltransferase
MVLAAGRGERMRPLSDVCAKPALPLPGGPVLAWGLRQAAAYAERVVVNAWHVPGSVEAAVRSVHVPGVEVAMSVESVRMGTAGALALARHRGLLGEGSSPILVVNGDGVVDLDLGPLVDRHLSRDELVTLALLPHPDPASWARVDVDVDGRVHGFLAPGDPAAPHRGDLYPGVMLVARRLVDRLRAEPAETADALWRPALEQALLGGMRVAGSWREVGTPEAYLDAVRALLGAGSDLDPAAVVDPGAQVRVSLVGAGSRIAAGARVTRSVVAGGAGVGAGATVEDSVVLGEVAIAPGQEVVGRFLAGDLAHRPAR